MMGKNWRRLGGSGGLLIFSCLIVFSVAIGASAQSAKPADGETAGALQLRVFQPSTVLPRPEVHYQGKLGHTVATSDPPQYPPAVVAPKGAPNVLLIMTDDVGFGASSTFGGPIPTPTFDALAARGLRYNRFHTTALCSPTRAALLTGRNHHSVGAGLVEELAAGYDGYNSIIPKSAATIAEVLRQNGYGTAMFGKHHNTPDWEDTPAGPFDRWPTGLGFEYFYGFLGGDTDQFAPALIENTRAVEPPADDPTYILDRDLADHAITWIRQQKAVYPNKPFFLYYAPGTAHAPHQAPPEWIAKFKGQFDQGWDKVREETFARQKQLGVIPPDAELTPRPPEIPAWDSASPDEKRLYARMMEVYAGALAYADNQIGRLVAELQQTGQLDNTIVIYIQGDNGSSAEGGLHGSSNGGIAQLGIPEPVEFMLSRIDLLGGPLAEDHYPVGWAWAMDTPFQWMKQIASHFGGTRNGMVISWPARIKDVGTIRSQFHHVIDIAPTLYDVIGIPQPKVVNGAPQKPLEGVSMAYSFDAPGKPSPHASQYFEMVGNRGFYRDGWMASTHPGRLPWVLFQQQIDPEKFRWELYHVADDFSQAHNLAAQDPKRLQDMVAGFWAEAAHYNVLPIDNSAAQRLKPSTRPYDWLGRKSFTFHAGETRITRGAFPSLTNMSWRLTAHIETTALDTEGVIMTQGGRFSGWGLIFLKGKPTFIYKRDLLPDNLTRVSSADVLAPGKHEIDVEFQYEGGGAGKAANVILSIDGAEKTRAHIERTMPVMYFEDADVGRDTGTPVTEDYKVPFAFTGKIDHVDVVLSDAAANSK